MQRTTNVHDEVADALLAEAEGGMDHAAPLDAPVDVLDAHAPTSEAPMAGFLRGREGATPRLLGRHEHLNLWEGKRQKAHILKQPAPRGQARGRSLGDPLIVGAARGSVMQKEDGERGVNQSHVFHRVGLFLAAITARWFSRILGALHASFGPIMAKKGEAGGSTGVDGSWLGTTNAVASAAAAPRRFASSVTERVGVSPSVRSVACRTTNRT